MIAAALAALALAYLHASREYPLDSLAAPGPGVFPLAAGGALLALALAQAAADVVGRRRGRPEPVYRATYQRWAPRLMIALLALYAACLPVLGFLAASGALVVLAGRLMGVPDWWRAVALAAGVTVAVYALFVGWLGVPLPRGLLG